LIRSHPKTVCNSLVLQGLASLIVGADACSSRSSEFKVCGVSAKVTVVVVVATEVPPAVELPELVLALAAEALSMLISFKRLVTWAWRAWK
jgi:hypothetical protein